MPRVTREKRVTPAECCTTKRPLAALRGSGPGIGDQTSPDRSSLMNTASPVGSVTGSLANGVRRFSRLFPAHVVADPDAVMMVPNCGLAMTFVQGSGVSSSPSRTIAYVRPPSAKPPTLFDSVSSGTSA